MLFRVKLSLNDDGAVIDAAVRTTTLKEIAEKEINHQIGGVYFRDSVKEYGNEIFIGFIDEYDRATAWLAVADIIRTTMPELEE